MDRDAAIKERYARLTAVLDERSRRLLVAAGRRVHGRAAIELAAALASETGQGLAALYVEPDIGPDAVVDLRPPPGLYEGTAASATSSYPERLDDEDAATMVRHLCGGKALPRSVLILLGLTAAAVILASFGTVFGKRAGIARCVFDGDGVEGHVDAHPLDTVVIHHLDLAGDGFSILSILDPQGQARLIEEGLLVTEHDRLIAHLESLIA